MNKEQALAFLRAHQPMPDTLDEDNDCEELIGEWESVCKFFIVHPDIESVPLFLGSFGDEDGYEVYQYFNNVVAELDPDDVAPYLTEALSSPSLPIRIRAAEACSEALSNNPTYIDALLSRIEDIGEDQDVRELSANAISLIGKEFGFGVYRKRVESILKLEEDEHIVMVLSEHLDQNNGDV